MTGVSPVGGSTPGGYTAYHPHPPVPQPGGAPERERGGRRAPADWREALTELEGDVLEAEQALAHDRSDEIAAWGRRSTDWVPPSGLGPVPADLRERAARLLQHQLAVAEALVERIMQSQKQRDVAARMSYAAQRPVPSFIDRAL